MWSVNASIHGNRGGPQARMAFTAEFEPDGRSLKLRGECRMAEAETLSRALDRLRGDSQVTIDTTDVEEWDIGPAWLLYRALKSGAQGDGGARLKGPPPKHFVYFDEFEDERAAAPAAPRVWIARF